MSIGIEQKSISVLDYGARPDSGMDDSDAFEWALKECGSVFVPKGVYKISRSICLVNQILFGEGVFNSIIEMTDDNPRTAVIRAGRSCVIENIGFGYQDGIVDGTEAEGERIGLVTGCGKIMLQRGSVVRNVRIFNTGTAIYSAEENKNESFSVTYECLEICDFSYRGIDFKALNRTGNLFSNIYMFSHFSVDTLFSLETEESEVSIHQLNVEHTVCRYGIRLVGIRALAASTIHIEGITLSDPSGAAVYFENSSGSIESFSLYYSSILHPDSCLFAFGDSVYDIGKEWATYYPENLGYLRIGTLHLKGINDPNWAIYHRTLNGLLDDSAQGFTFFRRKENAKGDCRIQIDNYVWYTFKKDEDYYTGLASKGNIEFLSKGKIKAFGTTAERPKTRLCPYHTTYFDTDENRMVVWDGKDWV